MRVRLCGVFVKRLVSLGAHAYSDPSYVGDQVIGECCRALPSSSEGVTGKPAHRAYISVDHR